MLTVRRIGIPSYYRTAALATLVVSLLHLTFYNVVLYQNFTTVLVVRRAGETMSTTTRLFPREVYEFVAIFLMPILSILLWGWLINAAARLAGGLKLNVLYEKGNLTVTRISPSRASLIVALVAIPLAAVGVFVEAFASSGLIPGVLISVRASDLEFIPFVLTVLFRAIASYVSAWLVFWAYNRFAALAGGIGMHFCGGGSGATPAPGYRVTRIQLAAALRIGVLFGLVLLLFRSIIVPQATEFFGLQVPIFPSPPGTDALEMIMVPLTAWTPGWILFQVIHLFLAVHTLVALPLWALVYNWLARRFGGLRLEVEGDWPEATAT